jgi:hypothetical protein
MVRALVFHVVALPAGKRPLKIAVSDRNFHELPGAIIAQVIDGAGKVFLVGEPAQEGLQPKQTKPGNCPGEILFGETVGPQQPVRTPT